MQNLKKIAPAISEIQAAKVLGGGTPIKLKFGIPKGLIKANHRDMTDYSHKIKLNFCHAHRVTP